MSTDTQKMFITSSQARNRSMEDTCTNLESLKPSSQNWFVKVLIAEKTHVRLLKWGKQLKLVFIDKEQGSMPCIMYNQDIDQLDKVLQLYKTYFVGNGKIQEIPPNAPTLPNSKYQIVQNRSVYIKAVTKNEELSLEHIYQLTPFAEFPQIADSADKQIS
ncbi:hypothetical protein ACS0TY_030556 [Phlomoides rotata]